MFLNMEARSYYYRQQNLVLKLWPCGPMDKASDYESGDSRFESWQGRILETHQQVSNVNNLLLLEYQSVRVFGIK